MVGKVEVKSFEKEYRQVCCRRQCSQSRSSPPGSGEVASSGDDRQTTGADHPVAFQRTSMATESELVKLPSGVSLETKLHSPETPTKEDRAGLAVLLHPWSWLGGRMEDQCEPSLITTILNLKN